jgi:hypothetical protein
VQNYNNCTRCQFLHVTKDQIFEFNRETHNYDIKADKPKFACDFDKRRVSIQDPNSFCCDNFLIKDDEELGKILELMKKFEIKGW